MYKVQNKENIHIYINKHSEIEKKKIILIKIDNLLHNFDVKLYVIK